jgi:hypothetical protein
MTDSNPQPNLDPKTFGPALEALRQALPGLEKLVEACRNPRPEAADIVTAGTNCTQPEVQERLAPKTAIFAHFINGKGRSASPADIELIKPDDYSLYLNVASGMIGLNLPGKELQIQTVQEAGIDGVQDIFGAMIEYPHLNFGNVSIGWILPHRQGMTPDAFRKAMAKIRYAVQNGNGNGPLLLHFDRSHYSVTDSGHAWRISMEHGDLCFIRFLLPSERFRLKGRS